MTLVNIEDDTLYQQIDILDKGYFYVLYFFIS